MKIGNLFALPPSRIHAVRLTPVFRQCAFSAANGGRRRGLYGVLFHVLEARFGRPFFACPNGCIVFRFFLRLLPLSKLR